MISASRSRLRLSSCLYACRALPSASMSSILTGQQLIFNGLRSMCARHLGPGCVWMPSTSIMMAFTFLCEAWPNEVYIYIYCMVPECCTHAFWSGILARRPAVSLAFFESRLSLSEGVGIRFKITSYKKIHPNQKPETLNPIRHMILYVP